KVLGSHSAASVRCLSCKDKEEETRAPSPVRTVVNHQFEIQANPTRPRRPQSAGARLEVRAEEKAKTAPDSGPRRGNFVAGKQGPVVGIRGIAITAWRGAKSRTPMPAHPPRRITRHRVDIEQSEGALKAPVPACNQAVDDRFNLWSLSEPDVQMSAYPLVNLSAFKAGTHPPVLAHLLEEQIFDQELVSTAVSHDGLVLIFAPETMRDDEVVVQAAVSQNGLALEYASARLRSKCEIVLAALGENPEAVHHVLPIMRDDQEMMAFGQDRRPHLPSQLKSRLRPLALKMALARVRMFLEPLLKKLKVHWEQARPILRKLNSLEDLQLAADDPEAFLKGLDSREDVGMDWKIALLRPSLEPVANERSLWWDEMAPVLRSCSAKELKAASEDGKRFLDSLMSKTRGETARLLCIAQLRRPLSAVLPKGLPWHDVVPALHQVETVKELQTAREAPDLLLWKMNSNSQEWAPALLYQFLRLRPKMEPKLAEVAPGVYWEDFAKSLQALEPLELLQAEKSIYRFLQLLDIYPADPPGRWWFMARLRPHMELQLETQGNTWEEAVEMMSEMDAAFDLKPAIHGPAAFCLRLAEGPARLAFGAFGADGANRTLRPEDLQGLQIRVSTADSFEGAAAATESP
ncbi:unnamed protein product, partial [Effrenium voratum]